MVGISLFVNSILLGVTDGCVANNEKKYLGCSAEIYLTIPSEFVEEVYKKHSDLNPTDIELQPWGVYAFEVYMENYKFMIAVVYFAFCRIKRQGQD